jgi:hypothetical protein
MSPPYAPATTAATALVYAKEGDVRSHGGNLGLVLLDNGLALDRAVAAVGAGRGHRDLDRLVDMIGDRAPGPRAIGTTRPPPRLKRLRLGRTLGKRSRLPLRGSLRLLEARLELLDLSA